MKKITFVLFALIAGTTFAQNAATAEASATINAEIVSPIKIENKTPLDFGRIIGNSAGGTVSIAATEDGTRTSDNNDLLASTGEAPSVAKFEIVAANEYNFKIVLSETTVLEGAGDDMPITFKHNLGAAGNAGKGSTPIDMYLGGDLTVNTNQGEGEYAAQVTVTVTYE